MKAFRPKSARIVKRPERIPKPASLFPNGGRQPPPLYSSSDKENVDVNVRRVSNVTHFDSVTSRHETSILRTEYDDSKLDVSAVAKPYHFSSHFRGRKEQRPDEKQLKKANSRSNSQINGNANTRRAEVSQKRTERETSRTGRTMNRKMSIANAEELSLANRSIITTRERKSRSNLRTERSEQTQREHTSKQQNRPPPNIPFMVKKSSKPLTVFKEFNISTNRRQSSVHDSSIVRERDRSSLGLNEPVRAGRSKEERSHSFVMPKSKDSRLKAPARANNSTSNGVDQNEMDYLMKKYSFLFVDAPSGIPSI